MPSQRTLLSKINNMLRGGNDPELPVMLEVPDSTANENGTLAHAPDQSGNGTPAIVEVRRGFFRPWGRKAASRDQAIMQLQQGFSTLTELLVAVKGNLESSTSRHEELMHYLEHLPQALESLPEQNRAQQETLDAIRGQLEHHSDQQDTLAEILRRLSQTGGESRKLVADLNDRVEALQDADHQIAVHLGSVGSAMESVSKHSAAGTSVLGEMRDHLASRDEQLEKLLQKQGTRFAVLVAVAIFIALAALTAVCVIGYLMVVTKS